jgi:DNA-binding CsgD family transcriptional regulator
VLEASYRLLDDDDSWLTGLGQALTPLAEGSSVVCSLVSRGPKVKVERRATVPADPELEALTVRIESMIPHALRRKMHLRFGCESASEFAHSIAGRYADKSMQLLYGRTLYPLGYRDIFNVQAADPNGWSIWCALATRERVTVHPRAAATWRRAAVHVLAGFRLRNVLAELPNRDPFAAAEAVLDVDGRMAHAEGTAREGSRREELRQAVKAVDRARSRAVRGNPEEALELWRALFSGRWSIAEVFDSDQRRFYLAFENEPAAVDDRRLTRREGQIAVLAALGRDDSAIAYELGISVPTVRTHLERGLRKLGLRSRRQLIGLAGSLLVGPSSKAKSSSRSDTPNLR